MYVPTYGDNYGSLRTPEKAYAHPLGEATVMDLFLGLPIVGYERGEELAVAKPLGFEPVGPLRIWIREIAAG